MSFKYDNVINSLLNEDLSQRIKNTTGGDKRKPITFKEIEKEIQKQTKDKEGFSLSGKWKKYHKKVEDFKVYIVDGEWIKRNLSIFFGYGGHGCVHEFIPHNEIWINNTDQKGNKPSENWIDSTVLHEIEEWKKMNKGVPFHKAHQHALRQEYKAGLIPKDLI